MENMLHNKKGNQIYYLLGGSIFLFAVTVFLYQYYPVPNILMDEYGYWSVGAYFAGKDWSALNAITSYYAYGYGLLLSIFIRIAPSPEACYQMALCFNGLLVAGSFLVGYFTTCRLFKQADRRYMAAAHLAISLYPSFLFNAQIAWSETLLMFLFWVVVYFILRLVEKPRLDFCIAVVFVAMYMYTVHQRSLGILLSVMLLLIYLTLRKRLPLWQFVIVVVVFGLLYVLQSELKGIVQRDVWPSTDASRLAVNDFSGQSSKIQALFTAEGFGNLMYNILGRLLYFGVSTALILYVSLGRLCTGVFRHIKALFAREQEPDFERNILAIFLLMSFLSTLMIASIYMLYPERVDQLFYGRYIEGTIAPILAVEMCSLISGEYRHKKKYLAVYLLGMVVVAVMLFFRLNGSELSDFFISCSNAMARFFFDDNTNMYFFLFSAIGVSVLVGSLVLLGINGKKKRNLAGAGLLLALYWFFLGNYSIERELDMYVARKAAAVSIADVMEEDKVEEIYYYNDSIEGSEQLIAMIQFLFPDKTVRFLSNEEIPEGIGENDRVLVATGSVYLNEFMDEQYEIVYGNQYLQVLKYANAVKNS